MTDQTFTYNTAQNLTANAFTLTGHTFIGWSVSNDDDVEYANGQSVSNLTAVDGATINLYAVWVPDSYVTHWQAGPDHDGSSGKSYIISTPAGLQLLSSEVNEGRSDNKYFKLDSDIDMSGVENFVPIGSSSAFHGTFDGDNHTISHLTVDRGSNDYAGLFGYINHGRVENVVVANSTISGNSNIGGIVGYFLSHMGTDWIKNCRVVNSMITGTDNHVGGIVGRIEAGKLLNCQVVSSTITSSSGYNPRVGALIGFDNTYSNSSSGNTYHSTLVFRNGSSYAFNIGREGTSDDNKNKLDNTKLFVDAGRTDLATLLNAYANPSEYTRGSNIPNLDELIAYIRGDVTVPSGSVLKAPTVTLETGNSLTLAGGAQLVCDNAVAATVQKDIAAWTTNPTGGWHFIALPVNESNLNPSQVTNLLTADVENAHTYDLYKYVANNVVEGISKPWYNYRAHTSDFFMANGKGYLYANASQQTLAFSGNTKPYNASYSIDLTEGFNLVGNPYTFNAYVNRPYYRMNAAGNAVEAVSDNAAIAPCTGVVVAYTDGTSVTFTNASTLSQSSNGSLNIALSQVVDSSDPDSRFASLRGGTTKQSSTIDNAIVSFNEGSQLGKFYFGEQNGNIYIPQGGKDYAIVSVGRDGVHTVSTEAPINFKATKNGEYTITVNPEGVEMAYLHLIDNMTGADVDLLATNGGDAMKCKFDGVNRVSTTYTFTAKTTDYESRFKLVFVCEDANDDNEAPFAYYADGEIRLLVETGHGASLQVIDVMGRVIVCRDGVHTVSTSGMTAGVYVLRLINGDDVRTQKIIIQ